MAKSKVSTPQVRTSFGKKRKGVAKKAYGPKEQKPKKSRGQG